MKKGFGLKLIVLLLVGTVSWVKALTLPEDVIAPGLSSFRRERIGAKAFSSSRNTDMSLIPADYNLLESPPVQNGLPTLVNFSVVLMSVRGINEKDEEISMELNLRMFWRDSRLGGLSNGTEQGKFKVLKPDFLSEIWHPDVFIDHAIKVSQPALITKPASLRIYADSVFRYSARFAITTACQMDFHLYPMDIQKCPVQLKSYAYQTKFVELAWTAKREAILARSLNLPSFDVILDSTSSFLITTTSGSYSNLEFVLKLERRLSYYLMQTYLPSFIFIVVSWLSFLIPKEFVQERVGACMLTLLTLTVMFGSVGQNMPKVSYLTALDIWMVNCMVFVFMALLEYTVVLKLWSTGAQEENRKKQEGMAATGKEKEDYEIDLKRGTTNAQPSKYVRRVMALEKLAITALPSLFALFNLIYWPWLLFIAKRDV